MDKPLIKITLDMPSEEQIQKTFFAIVGTKHNNEDVFINDGGRRSYRSENDKKGGSHAYWSISDQIGEYQK